MSAINVILALWAVTSVLVIAGLSILAYFAEVDIGLDDDDRSV